jgi:SAM-dependent methyltransferase
MNEADIQVLASIRRAELKGEPCDRVALESGADRYWKYLEDWSDSWQSLLDEGLTRGGESGYSLTDSGRPLAEHYYAERPDHFWYYYQHYYPAAKASIAHSKLCERVFGQDLTQDGQADMESVNDLISHLRIGKDDKVLDLGCGAGGISEYISDETGAHVTGLDYAATAIETADTTLTDDTSDASGANGNWIANALQKLDLEYDVYDYTESFLKFWPKLRKVALELKEDFVADGNEVIFDSFMLDADEDYLPAAEAGRLRRYLYIVRV